VAAALAGGAVLRVVSGKFHMTPGQIVLEKPFGGRDVVTILALGEDETFSKDPNTFGRSDTILIGAVDLKNKRIRGISIPRDTRVQIPGREGYEKINAAYVHGGAALTAQTVANLLGVPVDYYIKTNIAGLKGVVDILGGVEIDIDRDMRYTDRRGGLYINLKKGYRHLDGDKALQYVRFRHDRMGDLKRIERQQEFLRALGRRMSATENWAKLPQAVDEIMSRVETTMTAKDLLTLARLSKDVPPEEVQMVTLPGVPGDIGRLSYYLADADQIGSTVAEMLRFQPPKPTVAVLNGSGVVGAAERFAELLRGAGYRVTKTANASRRDYPECMVLAADPASAETRAIADMLNCEPLPSGPDAAEKADAAVVVVVGRNYTN
jgi:LCP family protein required for cell wall assembly